MSDFAKRVLTIVFAVASIGCNRPDDLSQKQSVTVQLPPARPFTPEPGFTLAIDPTSGSNHKNNKARKVSGT